MIVAIRERDVKTADADLREKERHPFAKGKRSQESRSENVSSVWGPEGNDGKG